MNILVMAGTHDAVKIIKKLKESTDHRIIATTTTDYGGRLAKAAGADKIITEALNRIRLVQVLKIEKVDMIIDATHPFAVKATENAIRASEEASTYYIRFERPTPELDGDILRVDSFKGAGRVAAKILEDEDGNILHLAGVSTLKDVIDEIGRERIVVRVLPHPRSIEACYRMGIPGERIIAMQGTFSRALNREIMKEYNAIAVITKESGETGGLMEKVKAAEDLRIPVILVNRPFIEKLEDKLVFDDIDELLAFIWGKGVKL
ncbi:MAG TPA: precorrin-6A reductase [Methanothermobacter sp.]|jgi:precorrin-6A/cobalt-precorrin-6A reductase|uniref:Precorrin-6A reductase n=1 Tax=Methanothermobacter tenebrarum TaxID=680118 RepID=A0ABM7YAT4_9EURY|nr:precorrin-6A reductase [Methanothermobacter tenebrarum]MDI6881955.1 precorrin-6A reductase [Methanothermobacter sp.]MDX9693388.1 precorrin-6A reductase [Methanothermobacter sp.]BDH79043.1 precorrin-6A reductase [Methanothermobacter tenebrarum]HHW16940.1 precorrin-6A reductase [Methanothermobacter sp.]HOQ20069.1 precorrin-6A reductase [Methanothermobacter sp.]